MRDNEPTRSGTAPSTTAQADAAAVRTISVARALRDFGDGFSAILLPVYLTALGHGAFDVGLLSTVALLGSAVMTLASGLVASRFGERTLLMAACALMIATGLAFAAASAWGIILLVAFMGTINPSAGSVSLFTPLEQSVLARSVRDAARTRMFARYGLIGAMAAACGALAAGSPDLLARLGLGRLEALKAMFLVYAALGGIAALCYARLPVRTHAIAGAPAAPLGPSRGIVYRMAALFSVDSFAGGFAVQSMVALWLFERFGLSLAAAGAFFFWSGVLAAFSYPVAAWLSERIGLVNTMVYTHIPSSLCLIAAALVPSLEMALALLLIRAALSQMDVPTRTSYVMAVVTPQERPAAASVTAAPRGLAVALSPAIAGALFAAGWQAAPLIICGGLKIVYDLALLWMFRNIRPPEEMVR